MSIFFPPESPETVEPPGRGRTVGFRWGKRILAVIAALVVVVAGGAAFYAFSVSKNFTDNVQRSDLLPAANPTATSGHQPGLTAQPAQPPRPAKRKNIDAINYVLMGSDSRNPSNPGAGRSDSLMVLHLTTDRTKAYLISFPRDMYVSIPGHGKNKINAAFAFGGPQLAVRTLENLLDTPMDHVVLIDFDGFIQLTDDLGGVTVNNLHYSRSDGYVFPKGPITISGKEALSYVRERHQLPNGDLGRAERQRAVVKAILQKGLGRDTLANPAKFSRFVSGVAQHMTVDEQLTDSVIRKTALSLRMTGSDIEMLQAPISGFGTTTTGQSIDIVDNAKLKELASALAGDEMAGYVGK